MSSRLGHRNSHASAKLCWYHALPLEAVLAAARGRGGGCGRAWSSGHARAVAETAGCRLGSRRSRRRPRLQLRRRPKAGRQATESAR